MRIIGWHCTMIIGQSVLLAFCLVAPAFTQPAMPQPRGTKGFQPADPDNPQVGPGTPKPGTPSPKAVPRTQGNAPVPNRAPRGNIDWGPLDSRTKQALNRLSDAYPSPEVLNSYLSLTPAARTEVLSRASTRNVEKYLEFVKDRETVFNALVQQRESLNALKEAHTNFLEAKDKTAQEEARRKIKIAFEKARINTDPAVQYLRERLEATDIELLTVSEQFEIMASKRPDGVGWIPQAVAVVTIAVGISEFIKNRTETDKMEREMLAAERAQARQDATEQANLAAELRQAEINAAGIERLGQGIEENRQALDALRGEQQPQPKSPKGM